MSDTALTTTDPQLDRRLDRFDSLTVAMHWGTLLLLVVIFVAAWTFERATDAATAEGSLLLHRSTGVLLWGLTLIRLGWKHSFARTAALPHTVGGLQRAAARTTEFGLYALLVLQPITGFLQSMLRGKPFPLLGFTFPAIVARDRALTKIFHNVHEISAWALLVLIALHAGAALLHHFVLRDGVLRAMLPRRPRAATDQSQPASSNPGAQG